MGLDLRHISQTLAIGGLSVYAALFLIRFLRPHWKSSIFAGEHDKTPLQHLVVYFAIAFALGILLEDFSKAYATGHVPFIPKKWHRVLTSESELRATTLFNVDALEKDHVKGTPKPRYWELDRLASGKIVAPYVATLRNQITPKTSEDPDGALDIKGEDNVKQFNEALTGVFYEAHNRVYRNPNYFAELTGIADRIAFTRTLTIVCLIFFVLYLASLIFWIPALAAWARVDKLARRSMTMFTVVFLIGIGLSNLAFRQESIHQNVRIFGYYASLLNEADKGP